MPLAKRSIEDIIATSTSKTSVGIGNTTLGSSIREDPGAWGEVKDFIIIPVSAFLSDFTCRRNRRASNICETNKILEYLPHFPHLAPENTDCHVTTEVSVDHHCSHTDS